MIAVAKDQPTDDFRKEKKTFDKYRPATTSALPRPFSIVRNTRKAKANAGRAPIHTARKYLSYSRA